MYAAPALLLKVRQISELNVCVGIWLFVKYLDITNGNQLEWLLMV